MGIFDDEAKKMAEEAAGRARAGEVQKTDKRLVVERVSEDLIQHIGNKTRTEEFDVGLDESRIMLRGRASGRQLTIECTRAASFEIKGDASTAVEVGESEMARRVVEWLQRQPRLREPLE